MSITPINYQIKNWYTNIRWENRKDFVDSTQWEKKHKTAILSIHFNNTENTRHLLEYLAKETDQDFDIVIIENSTKSYEAEALKTYCREKRDITIITPVQNIWSAGGYALGMEYIIDQGYEFFFVVEDDVIFIESNSFSEMMQHADEKTLTFIHNCKNTRSAFHPASKGKSRRVQIAGYPTSFIEKIGIIDPRYFFRGEDLERWSRIEQWIQRYGYQLHITPHDYLHPYLKPVNNNYARFYFSIRNQLLSLEKHVIKNLGFFVSLFFYRRTAITKALVYKETLILRSCYNATIDFLKHDYSFTNNAHNITFFLNNTVQKQREERIDYKELVWQTKDLYSSSNILFITRADREKIKHSNNILNLFTHGILISSSSTIFAPLSILAPKIVCINEFNLLNNEIAITTQQNKNRATNLICIIISLVASLWIIIIVYIIIVWTIGFNRLRKNIW